MTAPATGAFLNYDVFADHYRGETNLNGAFDAGLFTGAGAGTTSFIASAGGDRTHVTRLETTWTIDRPNHMTSIRIGDSISSAGPGAAPVRFAGIQYARNFAVQPGYITMPLPGVERQRGGALGGRRLRQQRASGPAAGLAGPVRAAQRPGPLGRRPGPARRARPARPRDRLRAELLCLGPAAPARACTISPTKPASCARRSGAEATRYGEFFASTTHRYGFSDQVTGEATAQASKNTQMAGAAVNAILFDLAQVGGSVVGQPFATRHRLSRRRFGRAACARPLVRPARRLCQRPLCGGRLPRRPAAAALHGPGLRRHAAAARRDRRQLPLPLAARRRRRDAGRGLRLLADHAAPCRSSSMPAIRSSARARPSFGAHLSVAFGGRRSASLERRPRARRQRRLPLLSGRSAAGARRRLPRDRAPRRRQRRRRHLRPQLLERDADRPGDLCARRRRASGCRRAARSA